MTNKSKWLHEVNHSDISFRIKHLMIARVMGSFNTFDANICTPVNDFKSPEIDVWINITLATQNENYTLNRQVF